MVAERLSYIFSKCTGLIVLTYINLVWPNFYYELLILEIFGFYPCRIHFESAHLGIWQWQVPLSYFTFLLRIVMFYSVDLIFYIVTHVY